MQILIFKTNLNNPSRIKDIENSLDAHPDIIQWNVDLNDLDNILRIVSNHISGSDVENLLLNEGYFCEELTD